MTRFQSSSAQAAARIINNRLVRQRWLWLRLCVPALMLGCGGQTGEYVPPDVCIANDQASGKTSATIMDVTFDKVIPKLGKSVAQLLMPYRERQFDEVKYVPFGGAKWSPEQVASVRCGEGSRQITPRKGSKASVLLRPAASPNCPSQVFFQADVAVRSKDGALAEVMLADVELLLESPGATQATGIVMRASQPIADMKGAARPVNATAVTFVVTEASRQTGRAHLSFTIPATGTKETGGEAGGSERYADWNNACAANCPPLAVPPADFCEAGQDLRQEIQIDGCVRFVCR